MFASGGRCQSCGSALALRGARGPMGRVLVQARRFGAAKPLPLALARGAAAVEVAAAALAGTTRSQTPCCKRTQRLCSGAWLRLSDGQLPSHAGAECLQRFMRQRRCAPPK